MRSSLLRKSFFITILLLLISVISKTKEQLTLLTLSEQEQNEIREHKDHSYAYLGSELSDIKQVVRKVTNLDDDNRLQGIHELDMHLNEGYKIGRCDEIVEVLNEVLTILDDGDEQSKELVQQLEDNVEKIQSGNLNIEVVVEPTMHLRDDQEKTDNIVAMQLQAQGIPIVIEGKDVSRDHEDTVIHGDLTVKDNLKVDGKSKFKKDTEFRKDVKIEGKLIVDNDAKFKGDVVDVACDLDVGCNILLLDSDPLGGNIIKDGAYFIHNCGTNNTFVGKKAGNFELTGTHSAGFGAGALQNNTTGLCNTAVGAETLKLNTVGTGNAGIGIFTLLSNTTGDYNAAIGLNALKDNVSGSFNVAVGRQALHKSTGNKNIAIGDCAGEALTLGDNNIYLGNYGPEAEDNTIRIGAAQESCFVQGIFNATLSDGCAPVFVNSLGQLGIVIARNFKSDISNTGDISDALQSKFQQYDKKIEKLEDTIKQLLVEITDLKKRTG